MEVSEERLDKVASGTLSLGELPSLHPLVHEALEEVGAPVEAYRAAATLALVLDRGGDDDGLRLSVAAGVLHHVASLSAAAIRERLSDAACRNVLLGIVCEALAGWGSGGVPREDADRRAVERCLYLVLRMFETQDEVDVLEQRLAEVMR